MHVWTSAMLLSHCLSQDFICVVVPFNELTPGSEQAHCYKKSDTDTLLCFFKKTLSFLLLSSHLF